MERMQQFKPNTHYIVYALDMAHIKWLLRRIVLRFVLM